jgi:hypothetical protein
MTPKKQVSPAIRILRGERDASARATHLEAATRKFLVTTNERKQMSTKTNFKRIALVAVAALGMGVLSSVPSQAVGNADSLTVTAGTQYTTATGGTLVADSGTAATAAFQFLGGATQDTYTLVASLKSAPATSSALPFLMLDTSTMAGVSASGGNVVDTATTGAWLSTKFDTMTSNSNILITNLNSSRVATAGVAYAKFKVMITDPTVAGTYVVTIKSTPTDAASSDSVPDAGTDVTITVSGATTAASSTYSKAQLNLGATWQGVSTAAGVDSSVAVANTASATAKAVIRVVLADALDVKTYANESLTVTTSVGTVGLLSAGSLGKSVVLNYTAGATGVDIGVYADGTAGTASITISTTNVTFGAKSVTFYSTTSSKIVATKKANTMGLGSNASVVLGKATDANGNTVGADATSTGVYAYSSNTAVISDSGTACVYNSTYQIHECALTGVTAGTANITLRNSATAGAASTVNSTEAISVTVSTGVPTSLKMEWNKATYAPGEKAVLSIWAVDAAGKPVGPQTISNLINASGISTSSGFVAGSSSSTVTIPNTTTSYTLATTSALLGASLASAEPTAQITVYMPFAGGSVSVSATGGASLPAAAQATKVTATATVTDSGAAALAAVTALATTVASLKTLITTLTNLVLKIQKKVKA